MKFRFLFIVSAVALLLSGCNSGSNQPTDPNAFRFIGRIYDFSGAQGRFVPGDSTGLFAGAPLSVTNRRGEYTSSAYIVLSPSVFPVGGASGETAVAAYKPYCGAYTGPEFLFSAKNDQRKADSFNTSCLFVATAQVNPGDNGKAVHLDFHPVTSQLSLYLSNLSGKEISSVSVTGLSGTSSVNLVTGSVEAVAGGDAVYGYADADSAGVYRFNLAPQSASPVIRVGLDDGSVRVFDITEKFQLISGRIASNRDNPIVIENSEPIDPEDFSKCSVPGAYSLSGKVSPIRIYSAGEDQYALSSNADSRMFRLQNIGSGWMFRLTVSPAAMAVGAGLTVSVESVGTDGLASGEYSCKVLKVDDSRAWLTCDSSRIGFIINVK